LPGRQRIEFEHRSGNDAERAFGADEQVLEVVAGIVLAQAAQAIPDFAAGQHDLQAERQFAHVAVAQHLHAAGVGGEVAANLAAAFRRQGEREEASRRVRCLLHCRQRATGFDGDGVVAGIDGQHAVQAAEAEHDGLPGRIGGRRPAQAGVAALRHDGHAGRYAGPDHCRHVFDAARPHDAARRTPVTPTPVVDERRDVGRLGQHLRGADDADKGWDQVRRAGRRGHGGRRR